MPKVLDAEAPKACRHLATTPWTRTGGTPAECGHARQTSEEEPWRHGSAAQVGRSSLYRKDETVYHNHLVSEHSKVKDDSLAQRVLAEGGVTGFLEHSGASCFYGLRSSSFADAYTTFQA